MGQIVKQVEIARPIAEVWRLLEDVRRLPEFSASTEQVLDAPERLTEPGQTFRQVVRQLGRCFESEWTVLAIEPGRLLEIEGSVGFGVRYRLHEALSALDEERTRMTLTVDYTLPFGPLGRVAAKLGVERLAEHEAAEVLEGLRALLEGDQRPVKRPGN
jgi:uncharacterized membrane protein